MSKYIHADLIAQYLEDANECDRFRDGMLTLGTELRAIEAALDDERINLTHTAAQVAAEMRDKINELHAQIQRLISERNAFGLAIDRALSGIVPDEHPLRSRLVEIATLKARLVEYMQQEPVAWMCPDDPDSATAFSWRPVACELASCLKQRVPLYLAPGAQENNDV